MPAAADPRETGSLLQVSRTLHAPCARVWPAWRDAAILNRWWGPKGCTLEFLAMDFRPGGYAHFSMSFPDGAAMYGRFVYRDIEEQRRIAWLHGFATARGAIARAPFAEHFPLECENAAHFDARGGETVVTLTSRPFAASDAEIAAFDNLLPAMEYGYGAALEQLSAELARSSDVSPATG